MKITLRLLAYVKYHWLGMFFSFILLVMATASELVMPRFLGQGIDTALNSGAHSTIIMDAILVVGAAAITGFANFGSQYLAQRTSQSTAYDMRNELYDHLQRLSFAYYDKAQTGQILSRATVDVEAVREFIARGVTDTIQNVLMLIGVLYLLFSLNWQLALITSVFLPPIGWVVYYFGHRVGPMWLKVQQTMGALGNTLQENLMGVRVVKAFSRQEEESRKFDKDARILYDQTVFTAKQQALNMPLMFVLMGIPAGVILWYGGRQVIEGTLTVGGVTQFILYLGMLAWPIQMMGQTVNTYTRFVSGGQRILEILDTESAVKDKPGAITLNGVKGRICFENVNFSYTGNEDTLRDINFSAESGQKVALVGVSGSGKSTITHLMLRFYDVTSGRITIDGVDVRDVTLASMRQHIGVAQQDVFLFNGSIRTNIGFGLPEASMEQIIAAAKTAQIHDFVQSLPEGYDTWVGERGLTLSGGEKQRIVIARTLLMNPSVLILDDSTSSVDARTEHLIRNSLEELIKGRTAFIITHRLPVIRNADLILVLKDGQIVEKGKHDDLINQNGIYRQIYSSQLDAAQSNLKTVAEA